MYLAQFDAGESLEQGFTEFVQFLPNLVGALVVVLLGYIVAKMVARVVRRAAGRAGFDSWVYREPTGQWIRRVVSQPSQLLGTLAFWAIFIGALSIAVDVLGIESLENVVAAIYSYLPNVLAALLIFLVAVAISAGVAALARRLLGDTSLGRIVATAAPILVMSIATFMILDQLEIAPTIVTITYAGLIGALALGTALAFGLGGRDVAAQMLQGAYQKGLESKAKLAQDLQVGVNRARQEAEAAKERVETGPAAGTSQPRPR
jgi:Conserved TM helix